MNQPLQQQIDYYRARASEYDEWFCRKGRYDRGPELNRRWESEAQCVAKALDAFHPSGDVLELACGTGIWTEKLVATARTLTAVDASPEMIAINRARVRSDRVHYIQADLFTWELTQQFDTVFFGFWLSHVPPEKFESFWGLVRRALRPTGGFFFVDSRCEPTSTACDHRTPQQDAMTQSRRLNDGREFEIYKVFYEPNDLQERLRALGWNANVLQTPTYFIYGTGEIH